MGARTTGPGRERKGKAGPGAWSGSARTWGVRVRPLGWDVTEAGEDRRPGCNFELRTDTGVDATPTGVRGEPWAVAGWRMVLDAMHGTLNRQAPPDLRFRGEGSARACNTPRGGHVARRLRKAAASWSCAPLRAPCPPPSPLRTPPGPPPSAPPAPPLRAPPATAVPPPPRG